MHDHDERDEKRATGAFSERRFVGQLAGKHGEIAVTFFAKAGPDGEVELRFDQIPRSPAVAALEESWSKEHQGFEMLSLTGAAEDGTVFESAEVLFTSLGHRWEKETGHTYQPTAKYRRATLRFSLLEQSEHPIFRMWVKGFECFPEVRTNCSLGEVVAWGVARLTDPDVITGGIEIRATNAPPDPDAWLAAAEKLGWHIRSVLSFAASVTLRAPLTDAIQGTTSVVSCRSQVRQIRPQLQTFTSLHLQPIFEAAVSSHFDPHPDVKGLGMAIEWMAQESTYNEVRLFSAMTALEHLLDANLSDEDKYVFSAKDFGPVAEALANALGALDGQAADPRLGEIQPRLGDLRRRSLRRKLWILLERWAVPIADIGEKRIKATLQARNRVVHTGEHHDSSLWPHVSVIRELVVRIILTALQFEGEYASYLDGARRVQFPPKISQ